MRVGMILDKEYPPDVRVRREARALLEAGHEVILLARNREGAPRRETVGGIDVRRLPDLRPLGARAARLLTIPQPANPFYAAAIARLVMQEGVDVLHVHDLPLVVTAAALARPLRIPVIFDLHEDYPAMVADRVRHPAARLVFQRLRALHHLERAALAAADHCLVVVGEQRERLVRLGVPEDRITVVPNVIDLDELAAPPPEAVRPTEGPVVFLYTGLFGSARGLDLVIDALARLPRDLDVRLCLVGDGAERPALEAQAQRLGVADRIEWMGWQPQPRIPEFMATAHVGLVPHRPTPHVQTTMPNKIFEFLAFELPVITSDAGPLARVVDEARCGISVDVSDPQALADAMRRLAEDGELRRRLGASGADHVRRRWNWRVLGAPAVRSAYERVTAVPRAA